MTSTQIVPDPKWIKHYLREAADTLHRLPRAYAKPRLTGWPDVVQNSFAYDHSPSRTRPASPSPAAIDRLDESLGWMFVCDQEQRIIVWARACGIAWRRIEDMDGRSHMTLRRIEDRGLAAIRDRLRATPLRGFLVGLIDRFFPIKLDHTALKNNNKLQDSPNSHT